MEDRPLLFDASEMPPSWPETPREEEPREIDADEFIDDAQVVSTTDAMQPVLFELPPRWKNEWVGMPEFVQEDLTPFKTLYVHFETRADMEAFSRLVEQTVNLTTRSIWYPKAEIGHFINKRWVDAIPSANGRSDVSEKGSDDGIETFDDGEAE